jgi:23S rRNA (cytidine2498-2'-O)-methyltransferase
LRVSRETAGLNGLPEIHSLILYCRAGFEKECAAEIADRAAAYDVAGYCKAKPDSGYVQFVPGDPAAAIRLENIRPAELIFARQVFFGAEFLGALPVTDRLEVLLPAIRRIGELFASLRLETADTNQAKELSVFCRKFAAPLRQALQRLGLDLAVAGAPNLHLFFLSSTAVHVGWSDPAVASPWLMGIPRLKFPGGAPSRSTLKLEEAFLAFLSEGERQALLKPGLTAVDLGAAPGGWTWQLVRRGIRVTAVDNGPIAPAVMESGLVEHLRVDGFRYRPLKPVDWLVCDIVEQPVRIAALVARWLREGACRRAIFNLKLPMKKRYEEVRRCRDLIEEALAGMPGAARLRFKQLYHDREEVTGYVAPADNS